MSRRKRFAVLLAAVVALAGVFVATAAALRFTDDSCRNGDTGGCSPAEGVVGNASYAHKLSGEGGNGPPFTYVLEGGSLPPGLALNSNTGLISGRPTNAGGYTFGVELQDNPVPPVDWCNSPARQSCAWQEFTINILAGLSIETKSLLDKPGSIGVAYTAPLSAMLLTTLNPPTGTVPTGITWSVLSGALPPGLSIVAGVISGTPTTAGSYTFTMQAALDPQRKDTETLQIDVTAALAISAQKPFASTSAGAVTLWEVGLPFSSKLVASGGTGTNTWSLADGALPTGMALAADGTVTGTPSVAGVSRATIHLADSVGRTADYQAVIGVAPRLTISTTKLRPGKVGRVYRAKLATKGGVLQKKWKVTSGPLPRGIRLDRTLGVLSGTPTKPGRYRVTFEATDALKVKAMKTLVIEVLA